MKHFVVFKKQGPEKKNPYSLVDDQTYNVIPKKIILTEKLMSDNLYSTEELDKLRDELCK